MTKTPQQIRNEVEKRKRIKLKINKNCYLTRDKYGVKLMIKDKYVLCIDDKKGRYWFFPTDLNDLGYKEND